MSLVPTNATLKELLRCFGNTHTPCLTCGEHLYWRFAGIRVEGEELILACTKCGHGTAALMPRTLPADTPIICYPEQGSKREMAPGAAMLFYGQVRRAILAHGR